MTTTIFPTSEFARTKDGIGNHASPTLRTSKPAAFDSANDAKPWPQSTSAISENHAMGTIDHASQTKEPSLENATSDPLMPRCSGTATSVLATPRALTIRPTRTDHLDTTLACLQDSIAGLAEQNTRYFAMMAKTNTQILEDLQQLVQLLPQSLAIIAKHIPVPVTTRLMTSSHLNTYTRTMQTSWPPPKLLLQPVPALLTPHPKSVRFKPHAPSSCIKSLSWPNDMRPP